MAECPISANLRERISHSSFRRKPESKEASVNKQAAVYILASKRNGTLYIGVTSDLIKRIWEHKNNMVEGFTKRYGVHQLVWYEVHESMESAIELWCQSLNCELNLPLFTIQHNDTNSFLSYYLIKDGMKGFLGSLRQDLQKIFPACCAYFNKRWCWQR
jgi:predicted GIY-YIG superfamily endonuclease